MNKRFVFRILPILLCRGDYKLVSLFLACQLNGDKSDDLKEIQSPKNNDSSGIHKSEDNESKTSANNTTVKYGNSSIRVSINNAIKLIE